MPVSLSSTNEPLAYPIVRLFRAKLDHNKIRFAAKKEGWIYEERPEHQCILIRILN